MWLPRAAVPKALGVMPVVGLQLISQAASVPEFELPQGQQVVM
ncbi:MAG: hypothetical protein ACLQGU_15525 [bacterium]